MKKYLKYLAAAGMLGLAGIFFYLSAASWGSMILEKNQVRFYLEQPISGSEAVKIVESSQEREESKEEDNEQITDFCIWGQRERAVLSNDNLSRNILANVIMMCGNPELLFEDCRVPGREDLQGCLIDQESAWQLFGSSNVVGKEITYNGKNYTIRKVIPGTEKIAAFQISRQKKSKNEGEQADHFEPLETDECQLNRLTVHPPRDWTIQALQEAWSNQYGFVVELLDMELLRGLAGGCVLLVPITVCLMFLLYLCHQYRSQEKMLGKITVAGLVLILAGMAWFFLKKWVQIPDDYIPTKWSQFYFWTALWEQKLEQGRLLLKMPKSVLDYSWIRHFSKTIICGLFGELLLIAGGIFLRLILKHKQKRDDSLINRIKRNAAS